MSTSTPQDKERRRMALFFFLLIALAMLLSSLATAAIIDNGEGKPLAKGASPSPSVASTPQVVQATSQPVEQSVSPVTTTPQPVAAGPGNGNGNGNGSANGNGSTVTGYPITVTGVATGALAPGKPTTLLVSIGNNGGQDLTVASVSGTVTSVTTGSQAGKPACNRSWFHIGTFSGAKSLTGKSTAQVVLALSLDSLSSTNQDNCKGVTYTFELAAQARQS